MDLYKRETTILQFSPPLNLTIKTLNTNIPGLPVLSTCSWSVEKSRSGMNGLRLLLGDLLGDMSGEPRLSISSLLLVNSRKATLGLGWLWLRLPSSFSWLLLETPSIIGIDSALSDVLLCLEGTGISSWIIWSSPKLPRDFLEGDLLFAGPAVLLN